MDWIEVFRDLKCLSFSVEAFASPFKRTEKQEKGEILLLRLGNMQENRCLTFIKWINSLIVEAFVFLKKKY